jgi:hypothetical protein
VELVGEIKARLLQKKKKKKRKENKDELCKFTCWRLSLDDRVD